MAHWYCDNCGELSAEEIMNIVYKYCQYCGGKVIWVDVTRGILFTDLQGDYYELTGKKPLGSYRDFNGKYIVTATPGYLKYLEKQLISKKE